MCRRSSRRSRPCKACVSGRLPPQARCDSLAGEGRPPPGSPVGSVPDGTPLRGPSVRLARGGVHALRAATCTACRFARAGGVPCAGGIAGPFRPGPGPKGVAAPLWKPPPAAKADQAKRPEAASGWAGHTDRGFPIGCGWGKSGQLPHRGQDRNMGPRKGQWRRNSKEQQWATASCLTPPAFDALHHRSLSGGLRPLYRRPRWSTSRQARCIAQRVRKNLISAVSPCAVPMMWVSLLAAIFARDRV
jgi:hypothetical protein